MDISRDTTRSKVFQSISSTVRATSRRVRGPAGLKKVCSTALCSNARRLALGSGSPRNFSSHVEHSGSPAVRTTSSSARNSCKKERQPVCPLEETTKSRIGCRPGQFGRVGNTSCLTRAMFHFRARLNQGSSAPWSGAWGVQATSAERIHDRGEIWRNHVFSPVITIYDKKKVD